MYCVLFERNIVKKLELVPIKYCTEVPGKKNTSFVIMDFMGKSLLCAWRNNKTCKVGMPFLCKRVICRGIQGSGKF